MNPSYEMSRSEKGFTQCHAPPLCKPTAPPHFRQETKDNQCIALLECNLNSTYRWTCYTEYLKNHDRKKNANDLARERNTCARTWNSQGMWRDGNLSFRAPTFTWSTTRQSPFNLWVFLRSWPYTPQASVETSRQARPVYSRERPDHHTGKSVRYSLRIVCGFFSVSQLFAKKGCETGPPAFNSYPRWIESLTISWCNDKVTT